MDYISLSARYVLDAGMHVVVEGILYEDTYGDMLRQLIADHRGVTNCYRYMVSFDETVRRHSTKANCHEFGEVELRQWWRENDPLIGITETLITAGYSLPASVQQVLVDCGWPDNQF